MGRRKKKKRQKPDSVKDNNYKAREADEDFQLETGWKFHMVPLIISVAIAVIFYILVFIFVK